nr:DoxX family membrane protein [Halomarina sp. BCD28]
MLFGGVLAYNGYTQLSNLQQMAGYADAKDVPKPGKMVPFTGGMLLVGGLGVVFWRAPKFLAGALATFLAVTTPTMHDFWNADEESKQSEKNHFLKNLAMLGAALAFVGWDDED